MRGFRRASRRRSGYEVPAHIPGSAKPAFVAQSFHSEVIAAQRSSASADPEEHPRRYWLPEHVVVCTRLEGAVLLDLQKNRYYGLGRAESIALSIFVANWPATAGSPISHNSQTAGNAVNRYIAALLNSGLLCAIEPLRRVPSAQVATPLSSIGEEIVGIGRPSVAQVVTFFRAYRWARNHVRHSSLDTISRAVTMTRTSAERPGSMPSESDVVPLVSAFRILRPLAMTANGECLTHSLALLRFLARYGVFPTWIIGVRLRPWRAHSWIQMQERVLDSTPEKVCDFTPILAV
ncbi:lasso peptide biosynthesis B2 protein [Dyella monticola]|uniref:Lasso peptide biosynthesis B2 protein n=1 Tax=Dyella monticola TaxID=1927958 RepID=A0A370X9W0_9GAMM|nr:lasso peptide biosynthesis B2 protein [Dyella monticola]